MYQKCKSILVLPFLLLLGACSGTEVRPIVLERKAPDHLIRPCEDLHDPELEITEDLAIAYTVRGTQYEECATRFKALINWETQYGNRNSTAQ